jgi:hypothetical protein
VSTPNLPDGFTVVNLSTGTRMWVGPEQMVVHAFPHPYDWEVRFVEGDTVRIEHMSTDELESAAVEFCRKVAGQSVTA